MLYASIENVLYSDETGMIITTAGFVRYLRGTGKIYP
jgi:hypothetical protein